MKPIRDWPIRQVRTDVLDIGYYDVGPEDSTEPPIVLLHGFPYSLHSFDAVTPRLTSSGRRVIVPHLRGHGTTRLMDAHSPRAGQQGALGADVIALMDVLHVSRAVLAGFDWGGRAACVVAAGAWLCAVR